MIDEAAMTDSNRLFTVRDPNFCTRCGCVLPLPTSMSKFVQCKKCQLATDVSVFHERVIHRRSHFNSIVQKSVAETQNPQASAGPSIDRVCSNCGNPTMTYKTQQTRSADEGQTVFYSCPECGNQEIEYS